ncbi:recombinase RecT, partial [Lacticaseibacillus paracasei]
MDPIKLMATLKATVFKNATDNELLALVVVANEYRLNPLTKEIYAFQAKGGGIVPVVSVDGWVSMVNDHPAMDGMEFEELYSDD